MTAPAEPRVRHRRSVTGRRALIAGSTALGITGAAIVTTTLLSSAGAATAWPTATGSKAVSSTIKVSGTYEGKVKTCVRFKGDNTGKEPTETGTGADGTTRKFSSSAITYK